MNAGFSTQDGIHSDPRGHRNNRQRRESGLRASRVPGPFSGFSFVEASAWFHSANVGTLVYSCREHCVPAIDREMHNQGTGGVERYPLCDGRCPKRTTGRLGAMVGETGIRSEACFPLAVCSKNHRSRYSSADKLALYHLRTDVGRTCAVSARGGVRVP
jgi:hypothetical protein